MCTLHTVFNTISPYPIYKLCLNTAYNYLITIYILVLPGLLQIKSGKSTYF